jgi:L-fuconolactonase
MRIDSHQHFWRFDPVRDSWITEEMGVLRRDYLPEDLAPELRANGLNACVAVQTCQSEEDTMFLLDLAERHPFIAGVVGWVDLLADNLPARLEHFSRFEKLRGFRHIVQSEPDDWFLLREDFCRGVARLAEFGFTYDILIYARQLPAAVEFAARFPEQRFVLDHIGKPAIQAREIGQWERHMRALAANPNVFCKLSGMITECHWRDWRIEDIRPYAAIALDAFGPDRLMFGSDWPVCLLAGSYTRVAQLAGEFLGGLTDEDRANVFGGNAARCYHLKVQPHGLTAQK